MQIVVSSLTWTAAVIVLVQWIQQSYRAKNLEHLILFATYIQDMV